MPYEEALCSNQTLVGHLGSSNDPFVAAGNTGPSTNEILAPEFLAFGAGHNNCFPFEDTFCEVPNGNFIMDHFDGIFPNGSYATTMQASTEAYPAQLSIALPPSDMELHSYIQGSEVTTVESFNSLETHPESQQKRTCRRTGNSRDRISCSQPGCKSTFGRPQEFRRHMKTKHSSERSNEYRCVRPDCDYKSARWDKAREHMKRMHDLNL